MVQAVKECSLFRSQPYGRLLFNLGMMQFILFAYKVSKLHAESIARLLEYNFIKYISLIREMPRLDLLSIAIFSYSSLSISIARRPIHSALLRFVHYAGL